MQESPLEVEVAGVGWRLGLGGTPLFRYAGRVHITLRPLRVTLPKNVARHATRGAEAKMEHRT